MADGTVIIDTSLDNTGFEKGLDKLKSTADKGLGLIAKGITAAGTALTGLAAGAIKAGIDFESAFTGVKKTVDATDEQLSQLEASIRNMAKNMPESASDIASVAEAAGQLGIHTENIEGFTKSMVELGDATNMTSDEAATSFARFANITGMSQENFDRLGSVVVALGNNLATTESEITEMAMRIAGAGTQVGMTQAQIMSFSGALSSVGIDAEAGGTAFSTLISKMQLATETGGKSLEDFANVAGVSAEQFKQSFKEDASQAIMSFIEGLGKCDEKGTSAIKTLNDMGITEVRMRDALLRASGASDVFTQALQLGNEAWDENTALANEANTRYKTMESQLKMLKNSVVDLGIEFYKSVNNPMTDIVSSARDMVDQLSQAFESGGFEGLTEELGTVFSEIVTGIAEYTPQILDASVLVIQSFIQGISDNSEDISSSAVDIITSFAEGVINILPDLIEVGGEIAVNLIEGLAEKLPELIPEITSAIIDLAQAVIDNADVFVEAGADLIAGLAEGLSDAIPGLSAIFDPLKDCFSWIQENAEGITASLIGIGTAMAVFEGYQVVLMFVEAIKSGTVAVKALEIAQAALNAIMMLNPFVLVAAAVAGLVAGIVYLWNTSEGFRNACIAVWDAIKEKISSVVSWFSNLPAKMAEVGRNIVAGIKNGIANAWEGICSWFSEKVGGLVDAAKSALGIHSPSRVMKNEVGKWIPLGIVEGIKLTSGDLLGVATDMAQSLVNTIKQPIMDGSLLGYTKETAESMVKQFESVTGTYTELAKSLNDAQENYDWWSNRKVDDNKWYAEAKTQLDGVKAEIEKLQDAEEDADDTTKKSLEAQIKAWQKTQKEVQKEVDYYKKAAQEEINTNKEKYKAELDAAKAQKSKLETLIKGLTTAIKAKLTEQKEAALDTIESEMDKAEEAYNKECDRIDAKTDKKKAAIQEEIDALDEEKEAEDRLKEVQEANNNIAVLQAKMNNTASEADKKAYALKIKNAKAALAEKQKEWDRTDEKAALKEEQEEIEERAKRKKERLKQEYEEEKEALQKKKEATQDYYKTLLDTDNLNAQVRYRMLNDSNEQLVQLLQSYAPYWQDAGQSLADSLINGLNSKREDMAHAVASMTELRGSLTGYASGTSYNRLSGLYNVDEKGFELSTGNNPVAYVSKGAGILNHMQSLQAIDKAVKSRVSEQMQALKNLVLGQQQQMYQLAGAMAGVVNNSSSIREGDINFNVEHYHNDRKDSIKETAEELGFYAKRKKRC